MENNKLRVILGIDVSTSCTGVSIASYDGEEVKVLYIDRIKFKTSKKFKGTDSLFYKVKQFMDWFNERYKDIILTDVVIEEPLAGSQNMITVDTLLKFNGMLSQFIFSTTGIIPKYISSYDARKYAFPELMAIRKVNKNGDSYSLDKIKRSIKNNELVLFGEYEFDCQKKYILWNKVSELYPDITWVYDKEGELKTENFDASDSLVCILGFVNRENYKNIDPCILEHEIKELTVNNNNIIKINYTTKFCDKINQKQIILEKLT